MPVRLFDSSWWVRSEGEGESACFERGAIYSRRSGINKSKEVALFTRVQEGIMQVFARGSRKETGLKDGFEEYISEVILSEEEIRTRCRELGQEISRDYADRDLVVVGVLRGAVVFMADLVREVSVSLEVDFLHVSSYGTETKTSGIVRILKDISIDVQNRDVLLVEDIVDTGLTCAYLRDYIGAKGPSSLKFCCLISKPSRRQVEVDIDYVGFTIADRFVIGYGLDCRGFLRNIPFVGVPTDTAWEMVSQED